MGPEIPYSYANVDEVSRVELHVQELTIPAAIRPGFTDREAVLNSSACLVEYEVYRF